MLDLRTIDDNIARLRTDLEFWEQAKRILTDPRIVGATPAKLPFPTPAAAELIATQNQLRQRTAYGDVRNAVLLMLPNHGGPPIGSREIVDGLIASGFRFKAKHQVMAVNDALSGLEQAGKAIVVRKEGIAKLWTKSREAPEGAS